MRKSFLRIETGNSLNKRESLIRKLTGDVGGVAPAPRINRAKPDPYGAGQIKSVAAARTAKLLTRIRIGQSPFLTGQAEVRRCAPPPLNPGAE